MLTRIFDRLKAAWRRFRSWKLWQQIASVLAVIVVLVGAHALFGGSAAPTAEDTLPTVRIAPVASLSAAQNGVSVVGTVRSESQADILAQAGGVVESVNTSLGASVPAGFAIASLESSSQKASVLQAQGAYDAAVAARGTLSLSETTASAADAYRTAYTTLDTLIENDIDTFFGTPTPYGPSLLLTTGSGSGTGTLSARRAAISKMMETWRGELANADNRNPIEVLDEATANVQIVSNFLVDLARVANERDSGATATQISSLATARAGVDTLLSTLASARATYRSGSTSATAGADASMESALGALRAAQANLEKTVVRAPIGGTVNFLSIHVGDYVSALTHVATVAQNGALEIVAYVSGDNRDLLTVGTHVTLEGGGTGLITSVSPALDPVTKQIEMHIAVEGRSDLENGEAIQVQLASATTTAATPASGPLFLPLTALKLTPSARVVFSVGDDGLLVAHPVEIGDVSGDRIEVLTALPGDLNIVVDARGLSEGEKVSVASTTP